ncbi:hypothetical protein AG1IA_04114 [Rhizoctonia solani AG-1 IA]|uniref:Uncharacterized protein n=1 Tax=Thanatephorus cucumeris (strain AG1-IA) TaxID=983506 RepID=L8WYN3_THACA|nr:hypothetical protein AG1IA_04114 [Rhizoctonia solani AG-1 IA]
MFSVWIVEGAGRCWLRTATYIPCEVISCPVLREKDRRCTPVGAGVIPRETGVKNLPNLATKQVENYIHNKEYRAYERNKKREQMGIVEKYSSIKGTQSPINALRRPSKGASCVFLATASSFGLERAVQLVNTILELPDSPGPLGPNSPTEEVPKEIAITPSVLCALELRRRRRNSP